MPNLAEVWNDEYETRLNKRNLNNIRKFLDKLNNDEDWQNPHTYYITEYKPKETDDPLTYTPNKYKLQNLKMSIENDGIAYFDDGEGILEEAMIHNTPLPLQTIIISNVLIIGHVNNIITISMDYGFIRIEY